MKAALLAVSLFVSVSPATWGAPTATLAQLLQANKNLGCHLNIIDTPTAKSFGLVRITCSRNQLIKNAKFYQRHGGLNPAWSQNRIDTHRHDVVIAESAYVNQMNVYEIYNIFPQANVVHFQTFVKMRGTFGHAHLQHAYSYFFYRALYNKINWNHLSNRHFIIILSDLMPYG
jgi:hypothetical protein